MCTSAEFTGNKTLVCTVGDLKPGDQYRTRDGVTMLVVASHFFQLETNPAFVTVVSIEHGLVGNEAKETKLGRDRAGRLYASRSLNDPKPDAVTFVSMVHPDAPTDENDYEPCTHCGDQKNGCAWCRPDKNSPL